MALDKQIHIYSINTNDFYFPKEQNLQSKIFQLQKEITHLKNQQTKQSGPYCTHKRKRLAGLKNKLLTKMTNHRLNNTNGQRCRQLNPAALKDNKIVSVFESILTRTLEIRTNSLSTDFFIVQTYYFEIIHDLILNGFDLSGEHYILFSASAGQIRTKKMIFIKSSLWEKHKYTLMCGLDVPSINKKGGLNINKYLAYLALSSSATDRYEGFNIRKSIVVEDFETLVSGEVDYIAEDDYRIDRRTMAVPVTHTDGCGMILPKLSRKNFMIRMPWMKGLMAVFPFTQFIREQQKKGFKACGVVKDIYGKEHDILKEDIQIIFTKSQFKMHAFYKCWKEYQDYFLAHHCHAGICNLEDDDIPNAKLNYQMLQTLTDLTEAEMDAITAPSRNKIQKLAGDRDTMLRAFGIHQGNTHKSWLQQGLECYPEMLSDRYIREIIKQIKKSLVKDGRSGKLDTEGKYTYIIPDLYAFCERLFLGEENPTGLLPNGQVFCALYPRHNELDCLRSPHLYREHGIRINQITAERRRWFKTAALYTSCHDLISKLLQFDCDGDKSLVCADPVLVAAAKRHMQGIVPLYYNMKKAGAAPITPEAVFQGMSAAYTGGNIGKISNDITKIWNRSEADMLDQIKLLCMENNFTIDYAKTLYKPTRPAVINEQLAARTRGKPPHFFIYAKDKSASQVEPRTNHPVDRLEQYIPNPRLCFKKVTKEPFSYRVLMKHPYTQVAEQVSGTYLRISRELHFRLRMKDDRDGNLPYLIQEARRELLAFGFGEEKTADMLVRFLYKETDSLLKELLWSCFGHILVENIKQNLGERTSLCQKCSGRFQKRAANQKLCPACQEKKPAAANIIICSDCQTELVLKSRDHKTHRCPACYQIYRKQYKAQMERERRLKNGQNKKE